MTPYSYRDDADIPDFDDSHPVVVFDGICHFCSRSMRIVFEHEKDVPIYFIPTQSKTGIALLEHYNLDPNDPSSFIFVRKGVAKFSSTAVFALARYLKGWPTLIRVFWLIPRPITNFAYKIFALNRYAWFGKSEQCMIPSLDMKTRLLDFPTPASEQAA